MFAVFVRALNHRFVLTIHQIYNNWLISFQINLPTFLGYHVVRTTIIIWSWCVWFINNSVQIFMKTIQQICDQLSWVMLIVSWKHGLEFCYTFLEMSWWEWTFVTKPKPFNHFGILVGKLALSSQRIGLVYMLWKLSTEEIVRQNLDMWQTLQPWVHEAGISKISQPSQTSFWILIHHKFFFLLIWLSIIRTSVFVMSFIILFAVMWTVHRMFTTTNEIQMSHFFTVAAWSFKFMLHVEEHPLLV